VLAVLYCVVLWQCLSIPLLGGDPSNYYLGPSSVGRTTPSFMPSRSTAAEGAQDEVTGWNMTGVGLTCHSEDVLEQETNRVTSYELRVSSYKLVTRYEVRGTRYEVRGTRYEVRGTRYEVRGTRYEVRGTRYEVRGTRYEVRGTRYEVRGTRYEVRVTSYELHHVTWFTWCFGRMNLPLGRGLPRKHSTLLYGNAHYCTVLQCTLLYSTAMHTTVLFCTPLWWHIPSIGAWTPP